MVNLGLMVVRVLLLAMCGSALLAMSADELFAEVFADGGPVRPPYVPALYDMALDPSAGVSLNEQAVRRQERLEAAWQQHGEGFPAAERLLLQRAFGEGDPAAVLVAAEAWPAKLRLHLARLLMLEGDTAGAVAWAQGLLEGDQADSALRLIAGVARRREVLAETLTVLPLQPDPQALVNKLRGEPRWAALLKAAGQRQLPPIAPQLAADGQIDISVERREEWHKHRPYGYQEAGIEIENDSHGRLDEPSAVVGISLDGEVPGLRVVRRDRDWPRRGRIVVDVHSAFHGVLTFTLFEVDSAAVWRSPTPELLEHAPVLRRWQRQWLPLAANNRLGVVRASEVIEDLPAGRYILMVRAPYARARAVLPLAVSEIGLLAVADHHGVSLLGLQRDDASPAALLPLRPAKDARPEIRLDDQGQLRLSADNLPLRLHIDSDPVQWSIRNLPAAPPSMAGELVVWADRPLLQQGEQLRLRAQPRRWLDGRLQPLRSGQTLQAKLLDSTHKEVLSSALRAGHGGLVAWDLTLPPDAEPDSYYLHIPELDTGPQWVTVLGDYRLPPIRLNFGRPSTRSLSSIGYHSDTLSERFQVLSLSGDPIPGARVTTTLHVADGESISFTHRADDQGWVAWSWRSPHGQAERIRGELQATGPAGASTVYPVYVNLVNERFRVVTDAQRSARLNPTIDSEYVVTLTATAWNRELLGGKLTVRIPSLGEKTWTSHGRGLQLTLPTAELGPQEFDIQVSNGPHTVSHPFSYTVRPQREQHIAASGSDSMAIGESATDPDGDPGPNHSAAIAALPLPRRIDEFRPLGLSIDLVHKGRRYVRFPHQLRRDGYRQPITVGQTITLSVNVRRRDEVSKPVAVLLSAVNEHSRRQRVLHLAPGEHEVQWEVEADWLPAIRLSAHAFDGYQQTSRSIDAKVEDPAQALQLSLELPSKRWLPAQSDALRVQVRDHQGQPVAGARLSLRLLDLAARELVTTNEGDWLLPPLVPHWGRRSQVVERVSRDRIPSWPNPRMWFADASWRWQFAEEIPGGRSGGAGRAGAAAATPLAARLNRQLLQHWQEDLVSDAHGMVTIPFHAPSELGSYQIMLTALDSDGRFGALVDDLVVNRDVVLDVEMPPFLRQGDRLDLSVAARSTVDKLETQQLRLSASKGPISQEQQEDDQWSRSIVLPGREQLHLPWSVSQPGEHVLSVQLFNASSGQELDSLERRIPVLAVVDAPPPRDAVFRQGRLRRNASIVLPPQGRHGDPPAMMTLQMDLGPEAVIPRLARRLAAYPYGGVEQTASRIHGMLAMQDLLAVDKEHFQRALRRLEEYQHADGSWGWWSEGGSPVLSAYVVLSLIEAQQAGWDIDAHVAQQGIAVLQRHTAVSSTAGHQAIFAADAQSLIDLALARAEAAGLLAAGSVDSSALSQRLSDQQLSPLQRALAAHSLHLLDASPAAELLLEVGEKLLSSWPRASAVVRRSQLLAASHYLLVIAEGGDHPGLVEQRQALLAHLEKFYQAHDGMDTVVDAMALRALRAVTAGSSSGTSVEVVINDQVVGLLSHTDGDHLSLSLSSGQRQRILLRRPQPASREALLWRVLLNQPQRHATGNQAASQLRLSLHVNDNGKPGSALDASSTPQIPLGSAVDYVIRIESAEDLEHVILDIPRPAGCTLDLFDSSGLKALWHGHERERSLLAFRHLPAGVHHLTLRVRGDFAGLYQVPKAAIQPMYGLPPSQHSSLPRQWLVGR